MTSPILLASLSTLLLGLGACKDERPRTDEPDRDRVAARKVDNAGDRAAANRDEFIRDSRARIAEMNARIDRLEDKADAESEQAATKLRGQRDALAARLDRAEDVVDTEWEEFKADVDRGLTDLKTELDERF